jgi:hypothetical protein
MWLLPSEVRLVKLLLILTRPSLICIHCGTMDRFKKERSPLIQKVRSPLSNPNQKSPHSKDEPENPQAEARESAPP